MSNLSKFIRFYPIPCDKSMRFLGNSISGFVAIYQNSISSCSSQDKSSIQTRRTSADNGTIVKHTYSLDTQLILPQYKYKNCSPALQTETFVIFSTMSVV